MRRVVQCLLLLYSTGCSPTAEPADAGPDDVSTDADMRAADASVGPLMDNELWTAVAAADDPFDDRPETVDCERGVGWDIEPLDPEPATVGIDTSDCNYFGVEQPTLRAVEPGETLAVQLWHFQLEGDGPAHLGLALDGVVTWEKTIEIPRESELVYEEFDVPEGAPAGAQLVFHLHNHGLNSWNLIAIRTPGE